MSLLTSSLLFHCHVVLVWPCRTTRALSDKLFAQLDFDGSGGISFKEFLIGLEKMVMEEYCEDEEVSAVNYEYSQCSILYLSELVASVIMVVSFPLSYCAVHCPKCCVSHNC
jgi:hypothetical protein